MSAYPFACLSVGLSVQLTYLENVCSNFTKFFVGLFIGAFTLPLAVTRNVLPVLWMTSCVHIMVHIQWLGGSGHQ